LFVLSTGFLLPVQAQEAGDYTLAPDAETYNSSSVYKFGADTGTDIGTAIAQVVQFVFVLAVILALGFLVYGGIRWLTSGGDKEGVEKARNTIIAAIVGLIIIFLSYVILNFVLYFLTGQGLAGIPIPQLTTPN
jgi:hypothetical protein